MVVNMNTTRKTYACPVLGEICSKCSKPNHFASMCRSAKTMTTQRSVRAVDEDTDDVYPTQVSAVQMDDSQLVTLKQESGNSLRFQVATGAQCNVIPLDYKMTPQKISGLLT